ncbi:MAG: FAD-dependent oxidoreductase [Myxococcota bacterium]
MTQPRQGERVVILGGGLTGISTAFHLGATAPGWLLIEKEARLGGHARTDERDGFHFDKTGHWLHLRSPYGQKLVSELLPDGLIPVERRSRVFSHGALTRYPFQANLFGLPPDVVKECLLGLIEANAKKGGVAEPRNFEEYCRYHFGDGIARHFMLPYNRKLWGVEPREITSEWCSRFVPIPKLSDVVAGAVGANPPELGYNVRFLYPKSGGIETMTRALIARLAVGETRTSTSPDAVLWRERRVLVGGEEIPYRALVATIPLPELLARMEGLPAPIAAAAAKLRCTAVRYLNVALRKPPPADFHWIYVPEEKFPFYRVGIYTNAVPSMAPPGRGSLYVELADRSARPAEDVLRDCLPGLVAAKAVGSAADVLFAEVRELRWAYVVFDDDYFDAVGAIVPFLEANAIYPRGRYGSWTYNSMEDCILAGREVASLVGKQHPDGAP